MDYQRVGMKQKLNLNSHMSYDSKDDRVRSPNTNARTNCSSGAPQASNKDRKPGQQFFYIRKQNKSTTTAMRRSLHAARKNQAQELDKREVATAGSIDLKIKRDLFAKDIAYEGLSDTNLTKLSDREQQAKTIMLPEHDNAFRKTLE